MHPTVVVAAAGLAVSLAKTLILTHAFAVPALALPVRFCRDAPDAVLHLGVGGRGAPDLRGLPVSLDGAEIVVVVDDGVQHARVVETLDALALRRATVVLQGREDRCRR